MLCVKASSTGVLSLITPQPTTTAGCQYVIQSGMEITNNPFLMTPTEALNLGVSIAVIWVTVAVLKSFTRRS